VSADRKARKLRAFILACRLNIKAYEALVREAKARLAKVRRGSPNRPNA